MCLWTKAKELHLKWLHKEVFIPRFLPHLPISIYTQKNCKLFRNFKFQNCRVNIKADISSLDYLLYSFYARTLLMVRNLLFLYMTRGNYDIFLSHYRVSEVYTYVYSDMYTELKNEFWANCWKMNEREKRNQQPFEYNLHSSCSIFCFDYLLMVIW